MWLDPVGAITPRPPAPERLATVHSGRMDGWDAAIVIPARNEDKRLPDCLDAAGAAVANASGYTVGIVLVVNNSTDASARRARDWCARQPGLPFVLVDCAFAPDVAGAGAARRLGMDMACEHLAAHGALLTTDADTLVRPDWVRCNLAELRHAELICGTVLVRADEARALPPAVAAHGSAESDYLIACVRLVAHLDPQPHDPAPAHHNAPGASLALPRSVYLAVGGLPPLSMSEDRALAERVDAHDFRIRYSASAMVETSCRMTGRTHGGMAGALRARATEADPFADEWMEGADALALRHGLRGRLRAVWPDVPLMRTVLRDYLGARHAAMILSGPPGPHFGAFFAALEARSPALVRHRLRLSDCRSQLPKVLALLARLEAPAARTPLEHAAPKMAHAGV